MFSASSMALMSAFALVCRATSVRPMMRGATSVTSRPRMKTTTMISMRVKPACNVIRRMGFLRGPLSGRHASLHELVELEDRQQDGHDDEQDDTAHENHQYRFHDAAQRR